MIRILSAGPMTTVQDSGRYGWAHVGVPAAGPADRLGHTMANRLVGNPDGAAALECTLVGPRLQFEQAATVALVGGGLRIDGASAEPGRALQVRAGQLVQIGTAHRVRSYLAVSGGIAAHPVLGSRCTDTLSGLGPPRLADGDTIDIGTGRGEGKSVPDIDYDGNLRVLPGPRADWFAGTLPESGYTVDPRSDRVGIRLAGPAIERIHSGELPTEGMVTGAIQVPPDGKPIVLLPNHGVTGGYPVIAVIIAADIHKLGQLRPGDAVRFPAVDRGAALAAYRELQERYGSPSR